MFDLVAVVFLYDPPLVLPVGVCVKVEVHGEQHPHPDDPAAEEDNSAANTTASRATIQILMLTALRHGETIKILSCVKV